MSKSYRIVAPEALPLRPLLEHNKYQQGLPASDLNGVSVNFGTPKKPHVISAPTGEGHLSRKLRRIALTHSRFLLPKIKPLAKRWGVSEQALNAAQHILSFAVYERTYKDDVTDGVMSVDTLIDLLNEPAPTEALLIEAMKFACTNAYGQILARVTEEERQQALLRVNEIVNEYKNCNPYLLNAVLRLNSDNKYYRKVALRHYRYIAEVIDGQASRAAARIRSKESMAGNDKAKEVGNALPPKGFETNAWFPLFVSKPDLNISHSGLMGRQLGYSDTGKVVRNISRFYTDEYRRCFGRKTPALGAVVVFDCSGSMHLDDNDLEAVMGAAAGSTILCYSTGHSADEDNPNAWVVARKGRRVRRLPRFPGGNGCDAPALRYGLGLRNSSKNPVIWVSDQRVTGRGDYSSQELLDECLYLVRKHNIYCADDVPTAIKLLKTLQVRR